MSEIPFLDELGDALDAAIGQDPRRVSTPQRRLQLPQPRMSFGYRRRLGVVLVAFVIAGGATAAAAGLFNSSDRLVLGKVDCNVGTGLGAHASQPVVSGATPTSGLSFTSYCRLQLHRHDLDPDPQNGLIACEENPATVAVYFASGAANQCHQLGLKALPAGFPAAAATLQSLYTRLGKLQRSRDCWAPDALATAVRSTIANYGLIGWQVNPPANPAAPASPIALQGSCGAFALSDPSTGDPYGSLNSATRTVSLALTDPRSVNATITQADNRLYGALLGHCYSRAGAETLVSALFAGTGLTPEVATTTSPNTDEFSAREKHLYQQGCLIPIVSSPSDNDQTAYVWLVTRHGEFIQPGGLPVTADFHG